MVDYGQVTHNGQHSQKCVVTNNRNLDPDRYPWEGKVCRWDPWDAEEENIDPDIAPVASAMFKSNNVASNVEEDMKQMADEIATSDLVIAPDKIWDKVSLAMDEKHD